MALNYTTYVSQLANLLVVPSSDTGFTTFLPGCIDYAEQRIYRELDPIATRIVDRTGSLSSGTMFFQLSTSLGTFVVIEQMFVVTPSSLSAVNGGVLNPLTFTSRDFIEAAYPNPTAITSAVTGVPQYVSVPWGSPPAVIVGPPPDASYHMEVDGTIRPTPLSSANSSTYLTQFLPDLFMAASMVFAMGYQRDFGSQADNPQASQSWEQQYQHLFQSAQVEELRKKYQSQGWSPAQPSPLATARSG